MDSHSIPKTDSEAGDDYGRTVKPLVSIGLPVFNGEKFLEGTLDSICAQTFTNFELIISDNASTDRTEQICRNYSDNDSRIRYYRNSGNCGAAKNFNRVFELSSGMYFKWAAYDDLLDPKFLTKCVQKLERDSSIVLCHSKTAYIDENGQSLKLYQYENGNDSQKLHKRFRNQLSFFRPSWAIFGLIRADTLRETTMFGDYIGSDRNLLAELSLLGRIFEIPEYLFFGRIHPQSYSYRFHSENRSFSDYRERFLWWTETDKDFEIIFPHLKNCLEYYRSIKRVSLKWSEQVLCLTELLKWFIVEGIWVVFFNVYVAIRHRLKFLHRFDVVALKLILDFKKGVVRMK
ncbi:MAG: glycosyltransferase [Candidatus Bathyarchaeota archaeon]|nr:MAG: glycosyltransferase [Candidatus Bathyarchaeota archaeon]